MIKYALIGCGRIAPNHIAAAWGNQEKLEIAAVCDILPEHCEKVLAQLPEGVRAGVKRYSDYREMLSEIQPELVAIATESGKHAQIALDCISAGCNVIIEKPIALSIADADAIITAAKTKGVKVCTNHQNRFNKAVQRTRAELEAGHFGKLLHGTAHILWNRGRSYYEQAPWRGTWAQDGGTLMNQCIHNIDLLRWMMGGDVDEVFAYTDNLQHDYIEAEDLGMALVKFSNGSYGMIEGTSNVYPQNLEETLYMFGTDGTVKLGGKSVNVIEAWAFRDAQEDAEEVKAQFHENPPNIYGFGHTPLYADMIDAIENDRAPYVTGEDGKRALELVLAIYASAASGKPVKLPLERGSTMDYVGRFGK